MRYYKVGFLSKSRNSIESSRNTRAQLEFVVNDRHHPRSRIQLTLSVLRMDRAGRDRERHKRSAGRSAGRLFSGLANWFPAARLDYANHTCVLAFDWSARIPTQTYTRTHTHTRRAWPLCLSSHRPYAHDRGSKCTHTRRAWLTLRIRIPMSPECICVRVPESLIANTFYCRLDLPPTGHPLMHVTVSPRCSIVIAFLAKSRVAVCWYISSTFLLLCIWCTIFSTFNSYHRTQISYLLFINQKRNNAAR